MQRGKRQATLASRAGALALTTEQPAGDLVAACGGGGDSRAKGRVGTPLGVTVEQCQAEWFLEEMEEARSGNPVSMALVGQMLIQGYGCRRDLPAGREWVSRALQTAEGKQDYAHLLAGWKALYDNAEKQPVVERPSQ